MPAADAGPGQGTRYARVAGAVGLLPDLNRLRARLETDFAFFVEDDIVPPDDAAERLLRTFAPDVASCSGPYLSRYDPDHVVHGFDGERLPKPETPCVQPILSSGFGCLMVRSELLRKHVFRVPPGRKWYDPAFFEGIDHRQWTCLVDWSCECGHLGERRAGDRPGQRVIVAASEDAPGITAIPRDRCRA